MPANKRDAVTTDMIERAAETHTDLNMFHFVVKIMEGSIHTDSGKETAEKILDLCKGEIQRQLRQYDEAVEALKNVR